MKSVSLQVISSSPADSRIIEQSGADRIQLVSALQIGGVTPSYSTIRKSLQAASIPQHVIIRPHNNGFIFTQEEKSLMLDDILITKDLKAHGVVIGSLIQSEEKQMKPDYEFIEQIVKEVGGKMNIVFHKASDLLTLYAPTLSQLTQRGVTTILTQGGTKPLLENSEKLRNIQKEIWPQILLGGGITHANKIQIIQKLHPNQIHIGTCVRTNKYGPVDRNKIQEFLDL